MVRWGLWPIQALMIISTTSSKKHEFTRPEKENDRIRHMATLSCHPEPVFLTYPDVDEITPIMEAVVARKAVYDFTSEDGIQHTFWVIDDASEINVITEIFREKVPFTLYCRRSSPKCQQCQSRSATPGG